MGWGSHELLRPISYIVLVDTQWRTHELHVGGDPKALAEPEWLITNGTGAFAMGTAAGINTRRYHGLLIAAARPPVGRIVALNQMLEELVFERDGAQQRLEFSACMFREPGGNDVIAPVGLTMLRRFERGLSVAWHYARGEFKFSRELYLHWKQQAATLRYTLRGTGRGDIRDKTVLRLSPMLTLRDFHELLHKDTAEPFNVKVSSKNDQVTVSRGDAAVTLACDDALFREEPRWWHNHHYPIETGRGLDDCEDHYLPGVFEVQLDGGDEHVVTLTVALGEQRADASAGESKDRQVHLSAHAQHIGCGGGANERFKRALVVAADDFVVDRTVRGQKLASVIAGYPWFADWGRDTFVSLPGLLLTTGRFDEAKATLHAFAEAIRGGLVPNRFDDYDDTTAHYNTVDASLWFVHAAMQYLSESGDRASWDRWLSAACLKVIDAYLKGTDYDIKMAGDGLISAGSHSTQLTWMDGACDGTVFTPRPGKAVEINALWFNALIGMAELLDETDGATADHYRKLGKRVERAFIKVFWDAGRNCLNDHVCVDDHGNEHVDQSIRPNQIFVVSLPRSPLPLTKRKLVVKAVASGLLTPFGLRTLPPDDPHYHARYAGDRYHRDEAYHQGTVWPWLIGPYAEAVLRVGKFSDRAKREALDTITPLLETLTGGGDWPSLGQLHEIHEADPPHRPVGCIAQAWSVAEVLRVLRLIETS